MKSSKTVFILLVLVSVGLLSPLTVQPVQGVFGNEDVFFEFGAETGTVGEEPQPPWDVAGPNGGGDHSGSYVHVDTTHVRSGTKAVKFYQLPPTKSSAQRRVELREYSNMKKHYFVSWWCYFPSDGFQNSWDFWATIGGVQFFWSEAGESWQWWMSARFVITDMFEGHPDRTIRFGSSWSADGFSSSSDQPARTDRYESNYKLADYLDQWVHFQVEIKWSNTTDGYATGWFNNNLIGNATGKRNDPTGYPEWSSKGCYSAYGPNYPFALSEYYSTTDSPEGWYWMDDFVVSDEKVSESYGVTYPSSQFERWTNSFEEGDFSEWNGTSQDNGGSAPNIISTDLHSGTYSANFSTDGTDTAYSRAKVQFQDVDEIYFRTWVKFSALADNNTRLYALRVANSSEDYLAVAGIRQSVDGHGWCVATSAGLSSQFGMTDPTAGHWHCLELYVKSGANANITLFVNGTKYIERTGDDLSARGQIARFYVQCFVYGAQGSGVAFKHDDVIADSSYIGTGEQQIFQSLSFFTGDEVGDAPIGGISINGTSSDSGGYAELTDLTYNTVYVFVIGPVTTYYPAWVLNVEGSFSWNGTCYILSHNFTESFQGYIEVYFSSTQLPYVQSIDATLDSASVDPDIEEMFLETSTGTSIEVGVPEAFKAEEDGEPAAVEGVSDWSYDKFTRIASLLSSSTTVTVDWSRGGGSPPAGSVPSIDEGPEFEPDIDLPEIDVPPYIPEVGLWLLFGGLGVVAVFGLFKKVPKSRSIKQTVSKNKQSFSKKFKRKR